MKGNSGEILTTIVVIGLAAILLFIFPMQSMSEKSDAIAQSNVQSLVTSYVNKVSTSGVLNKSDYEKLESELAATGNSYDIEMEVRISDKNPGKKNDNQKLGDTTYYSIFTEQIKPKLDDTVNNPDGIRLKQGDYLIVKVKNNNTTISQMFKNLLYGLTGNESYVVFVKYSSSIIATGNV